MYKKYVWYKVFYKTYSKYCKKYYITFQYAMNTDKDPDYVEKIIEKYGNNFVEVKEWIV